MSRADRKMDRARRRQIRKDIRQERGEIQSGVVKAMNFIMEQPAGIRFGIAWKIWDPFRPIKAMAPKWWREWRMRRAFRKI